MCMMIRWDVRFCIYKIYAYKENTFLTKKIKDSFLKKMFIRLLNIENVNIIIIHIYLSAY